MLARRAAVFLASKGAGCLVVFVPEVCSHGLEHVMLCYEDDGSYSYLSPWVTIQEGRYVAKL
jgi:hypothetical protein